MSAKRDPDTGQIVVNGKIGTVVEWLRWAMPIFIIPVLLWGIRVEVFIQQGERYTPNDAALQRAEITAETDAKLAQLPPTEFRNEFDSLVDEVTRLSHDLSEHKGEFREFRGETSSSLEAIERLLRD